MGSLGTYSSGRLTAESSQAGCVSLGRWELKSSTISTRFLCLWLKHSNCSPFSFFGFSWWYAPLHLGQQSWYDKIHTREWGSESLFLSSFIPRHLGLQSQDQPQRESVFKTGNSRPRLAVGSRTSFVGLLLPHSPLPPSSQEKYPKQEAGNNSTRVYYHHCSRGDMKQAGWWRWAGNGPEKLWWLVVQGSSCGHGGRVTGARGEPLFPAWFFFHEADAGTPSPVGAPDMSPLEKQG